MHRRRSFLLAAAMATGAAPLWAGATVEIRTQAPAGIYLDGEYLGPAPMTLTDLAPGAHTIEASMADGRKSFRVVSPSMADVHRVLELDSGAYTAPTQVQLQAPVTASPTVQTVSYQDPCQVGCAPTTQVVYRPAPARRVVYAPAPRTRQVVYTTPAPQPVAYYPPAPVCTTPTVPAPAPRASRSNRHVRVRNTLLGLGAAAFLFKKLDDRRDRRNERMWRTAAPPPPAPRQRVARRPSPEICPTTGRPIGGGGGGGGFPGGGVGNPGGGNPGGGVGNGGGRGRGPRGNNGRGPAAGPGRRVGPPGGGIPGGRGSRGRGGGRGPL